MMPALSSNTQAILLLTAPLIAGRSSANPDLLGAGEYKRLALRLLEHKLEPADLLASSPMDIVDACGPIMDAERIQRLLARGFQLSQAIERWQARAIWVVSRADTDYPRRLKARLRGDSPAVLYGCGDIGLLDEGGLAVVGSRHVDDALVDYTMMIGSLAARAGKSIVSGGAKGIDQAAMRGALEQGGRVCGVLADSLEKQVMNRDHRNMLLDGQLVLVSPYDPNAGFNVGNAMQRNKLIYAMADAALVVNSDVDKGGTWAGAVEQLDKMKLIPVYVRSTGKPSAGLDGLRGKGAVAWPNPDSEEALTDVLNAALESSLQEEPELLSGAKTSHGSQAASAEVGPSLPSAQSTPATVRETPIQPAFSLVEERTEPVKNPAEALWAEASKSIQRLAGSPISDLELAEALQITSAQAKKWLNRLVGEGVLEKKSKPVRFVMRERSLL
jgi:predicted Rossmann fold nucleotide-binding protein DprA/Smf involved in DNA uptake